MKDAFKKYRQLENQRAGPRSIVRIKFKLNDQSPDVPALRKRLFELGDLQSDTTSDIFDDSLQQAVKSFQYRYGMAQDGVVGPAFLNYINTPVQESISKIIINMERARWVPLDLKSHYLIINIPAFSLYAYDRDSLQFAMNVVVGKDVHKTVLFSGDIKYIVFSPYWNVPPSILKKEILPGIKKDPDYLSKTIWNGMVRPSDRSPDLPTPWAWLNFCSPTPIIFTCMIHPQKICLVKFRVHSVMDASVSRNLKKWLFTY